MLYRRHLPVLTAEIIDLFQPGPGDILLDATIGTGGHAAAYLAATAPSGLVVGIDADTKAIAAAQHYLSADMDRVTLLTGNFAFIKDSIMGGGILIRADKRETTSTLTNLPLEFVPWPHRSWAGFTHILFDLGLGSHQLDDPAAGFSFQNDAPLAMQYNQAGPLPAASFPAINFATERLGRYPNAGDLIAQLSVSELTQIIKVFGEEKYAARIAPALKRHQPTTTHALAALVKQSVPSNYEHGRINPATRTFQALRLAVNRELEALSLALPQAVDLLADHGVLAVISFHSLEDRIVKQFLRPSGLSIITKKPLLATPEEIRLNRKARTAKLRAARKKPPP